MAQVKPGKHSLLLVCLAVFVGSATGMVKNKKDSSHLGYFYGAPEHGLKLPSLREDAKEEVKEAIEEAKEEIEKEIEEKLEEQELLHIHSNEYIPPPRPHESERERRHGFRRRHDHHHHHHHHQ